MRATRIILVLAVPLLVTPEAAGQAEPSPAKVVLGEPLPELEASDWANYEGKPSLEKFREQIVVLFFFRTDDTSVDSLPALNELHDRFHQRGVVVIGLTPQKKEMAETIVKGKQIKFIVGYQAPTAERYQVSSFPKVYLLDTTGRLVDRFHPGEELEEKVLAQIRKTPPAGSDPQTLKERYRQARAAHEKGQYGRAYTLAQDVSKLSEKESEIGKRVSELLRQIEEAARKWLEEARDAARRQNYDRASRILAELSVRFAGSQIAADADTEIGRLMGQRELKAKLRSALDNAKAQLLNDQAADHQASRRYLEALKLYRQVTEEYPGTEAAKEAEEAIDRINNDPQAQETIRSLRAEEEAERWLDIADRFAKVEMYGKAREYYQRILQTHPDSRAASRAKERVAKLPEEKPEEDNVPPRDGSESP